MHPRSEKQRLETERLSVASQMSGFQQKAIHPDCRCTKPQKNQDANRHGVSTHWRADWIEPPLLSNARAIGDKTKVERLIGWDKAECHRVQRLYR